MDGWTEDRMMDKWMIGWIDGWTDDRTVKQLLMEMDGWQMIEWWMDGWMDGWMSGMKWSTDSRPFKLGWVFLCFF